MRKITTDKGDVYAVVALEHGILKLQLKKSSIPDAWITMDAKIIPQLRSILAEAEFFKSL